MRIKLKRALRAALAAAVCIGAGAARGLAPTGAAGANGVPPGFEGGVYPAVVNLAVTYWDQIDDTYMVNGVRANPHFEFNRWNGDAANKAQQTGIGGVSYNYYAIEQGLVEGALGADGTPVANGGGRLFGNRGLAAVDPAGDGHSYFYRWFHEVDGLSKEIGGQSLALTATGVRGVYAFDSAAQAAGRFFPLDNVPAARAFSGGAGDYSNDANVSSGGAPANPMPGFLPAQYKYTPGGGGFNGHNYHFTMRAGSAFNFVGEALRFDFKGDDDVWVFIDGRLTLDIGGLHHNSVGFVAVDTDGVVTSGITHTNEANWLALAANNLTAESGFRLARGSHRWDIFYAERNTWESNLTISTNMLMNPQVTKELAAWDEDGADYLITVRNSFFEPIRITKAADWHNPGDGYGAGGAFAAFGAGHFGALYVSYDLLNWEEVSFAEDFALNTPVAIPAGGAAYFTYRVSFEAGGDDWRGGEEGRLYNIFTVQAESAEGFKDYSGGDAVAAVPVRPVAETPAPTPAPTLAAGAAEGGEETTTPAPAAVETGSPPPATAATEPPAADTIGHPPEDAAPDDETPPRTAAEPPALDTPAQTAAEDTPLAPRLTDAGHRLAANEDGSWLELAADGTPLGTWRWDDELADWVFEPIPQAAPRVNPKTGDGGARRVLLGSGGC